MPGHAEVYSKHEYCKYSEEAADAKIKKKSISSEEIEHNSFKIVNILETGSLGLNRFSQNIERGTIKQKYF